MSKDYADPQRAMKRGGATCPHCVPFHHLLLETRQHAGDCLLYPQQPCLLSTLQCMWETDTFVVVLFPFLDGAWVVGMKGQKGYK